MKKAVLVLSVIPLLGVFFLLKGCIIQNPQPEDCEIKGITVSQIYEGGTKDITFAEANGDFYYINRGLERGLTIEALEQKVLNKKVTLHLANTILGASNHISQLATDNEIIFTEFSTSETTSTENHN
jgi:hypothetical protein